MLHRGTESDPCVMRPTWLLCGLVRCAHGMWQGLFSHLFLGTGDNWGSPIVGLQNNQTDGASIILSHFNRRLLFEPSLSVRNV